MTEPTPNDYGFLIFPNQKAVDDWIDAGLVPGAPAPLFVAIKDDTMVPKPRDWSAVRKDQALQLRRLVDEAMAKARGLNGPEYAGMRRFGYMDNGELVGGAVMWQPGAMTWPDDTKQPTEAQRRRWASRNGAAEEGGAHTAQAPAPTPPAAPPQQVPHPHWRPPTPSPPPPPAGFPMNTFKMDLERAIVTHPDAPPVMLVVKDGKITLKKLA